MFKFIKQFLCHPRQTGAVARFSDATISKSLSKVNRTKKLNIVEFGGGQGFFTRAIADNISHNAKFTVFEINTTFCAMLQKIQTPQTTIINDDVLHFGKYFHEAKIDLVISTLPLALFNDRDIELLLSQIKQHLSNDGEFIQLQYSTIRKDLIARHFPNYSTHRVLRNIPPACIFHCKNTTDQI